MFRKMMRVGNTLLLALLFTATLVCSASAAILTVEHNLPYDLNNTYMLRNGDTLHCLTVGHTTEFNFEEFTASVAVVAEC